MKIAVMQPYVFPYLGYFQLIKSADVFVFYDDVSFIKGGWINRNNILVQHQKKMITFPCKDISSFKQISETYMNPQNPLYKKNLKSIEQSYRKAPYFDAVFPIIKKVFQGEAETISEFAMNSVTSIMEYLEIDTVFQVSSKSYSESKEMERTERLLHICKKAGASHYINSLGGQELYAKEDFEAQNISLNFLAPNLPVYEQFSATFISGLSMIDVLMFNDKETVRGFLHEYSLV